MQSGYLKTILTVEVQKGLVFKDRVECFLAKTIDDHIVIWKSDEQANT